MLLDRENGREIAAGAGLVTYEADWFSGCQIQVFMGDVLIDNAVSISYQLSSQKIPFYGFGSEYYRFTAQSPVLITGQLVVAFKESGYLLLPARRYHNLKAKGGSTSPRYIVPDDGSEGYKITNKVSANNLEAASAKAKMGKVIFRSVEQYIQERRAGQDGAKSVRRGLYKQLSALKDSEFENFAEAFEDAIWFGAATFNGSTRDSLYSKRMTEHHGEIDKKELYAHRRLDQYPPIDIWITAGDVEAPDGVNHTVQKLLDVEFTSESKAINAHDGSPVFEAYSFIAKNRV
jgi:hypothetical protein